jgi:maleylacetate reductase
MTAKTLQTTMPVGFTRDALPGRIRFRDGGLEELGAELDRFGVQRAMLIGAQHDDHLVDRAAQAMGPRPHVVWDEIRQHVPAELAARATTAASAGNVDVLVTIGGGSTIGLGKAVAVSTGLPLVCVPTTFSGSEMTPIYGLTSDQEKTTARDHKALPKVVIYDPQLLSALPAGVVGPSGMNALAHCAEALWAKNTDPVTDALALDGARRLHRHLHTAYSDRDVASLGQVLVASCLAGTALGTVGTSIHHALCHLLGGMYDTPHALTHAIVLPYAVEFVRPSVPTAIGRLAAALSTTAAELSHTIWALGLSVGTPRGLRAIGLTEAQVGLAAEAALVKRPSSPRTLDRAGLHRLLKAAWRGMSPSIR